MAERCERTDLLVDQCAHCRGDEDKGLPCTSRPFGARYPGSCSVDLDYIDEGDMIVMVDGAAAHEQCARDAGYDVPDDEEEVGIDDFFA